MSTTTKDLRNHLFETIEMLKNNSDPNADPQEKIDIEAARTIAKIATVIVESNKVEVQALEIIAKAENLDIAKEALKNSNVLKLDEINKTN